MKDEGAFLRPSSFRRSEGANRTMSAISAEAVKKLRDMTSLPMMECKSALTEAGGDMEKAITILRERNAKAQIKRADREAAEGRIAAWIDDDKQIGAIVEVRC